MTHSMTSTILAVFATAVLSANTATAQTPAPAGPKKRIAVGRFDAIGTFTALYAGWDVGQALSAQLATELANTGRFIVLERGQLSGAIREQELGLMEVTTPETAARTGQVLGAELLVYGVVTEFDQSTGGHGVKVGLGLPGIAIGIGGSRETGHVAIDLRLVDTTTGMVVEAHRAEAEVSRRGVSTDLSAGPLTVGNEGFARSALGQAVRQAIGEAVDIVVARMETMPWTGRVVDVGDGEIYVNAGRDADLTPGTRLVVSTVARELVDPATGEHLGVVEHRLGEIEIESVQAKFSVARPIAPMSAERGDIVRVSTAATTPEGSASRRGSGFGTSAANQTQGPSLDTLRQAAQELDAANAANTTSAGGFYGPGIASPATFTPAVDGGFGVPAATPDSLAGNVPASPYATVQP